MTTQQFDEIMRIACKEYVLKDNEVFKAIEIKDDYEFSVRLKRRMNRLFRIHVGGDNIPHPDVDNRFEKTTTKIVEKVLKFKYKLIHFFSGKHQ